MIYLKMIFAEVCHASNWRSSFNLFKRNGNSFWILVRANVWMDNMHDLGGFVKRHTWNFDLFLAVSSPSSHFAIWHPKQNLKTPPEKVFQCFWSWNKMEKNFCPIFHLVPNQLLHPHSSWPTHHVLFMGKIKLM